MENHPEPEEAEYEGLETQSLGVNMLAGALVSLSPGHRPACGCPSRRTPRGRRQCIQLQVR